MMDWYSLFLNGSSSLQGAIIALVQLLGKRVCQANELLLSKFPKLIHLRSHGSLKDLDLLFDTFFLISGVCLDDLSNEDELGGIPLRHEVAKQGVLHLAHHETFLFVASRFFFCIDSTKGVRNDRNQKIRKHNDIQEDVKEEDEPVAVIVELKAWWEAPLRNQEGILPCDDILLYVSLVEIIVVIV